MRCRSVGLLEFSIRVVPIGFPGIDTVLDGRRPVENDRVVVLDIESTPTVVSRTADRFVKSRSGNYDHLVVLETAHVLADHVIGACRLGKNGRGLTFRGGEIYVRPAVVDNDPKARPKHFEPFDYVSLVEIVGDHADRAGWVGYGGIEQSENLLPGFKPHPR